MKRLVLVCSVLMLFVSLSLFSESLDPWKAAYGDWRMIGGRLTQLSLKAGMAQAYMYLPQRGVMQYEFDAKYVAGGADEYAAFGVHIGVNKPHVRKSWGNGRSFLLWLTYDPEAYRGSGVYGQAYKSIKHSVMHMLHRGNAYEIPGRYLRNINVNRLSSYILPIKIIVDYDTGMVKVYDPTIPNYYYKFSLGEPVRGGYYIAVRTNSLAANFGNFRITRIK